LADPFGGLGPTTFRVYHTLGDVYNEEK
jgi:hypothetical protein